MLFGSSPTKSINDPPEEDVIDESTYLNPGKTARVIVIKADGVTETNQ